MSGLQAFRDRDDSPRDDHFVVLHGISWQDYERVLEMRGDRSAPRISYLDGELEIMSPSRTREDIKSKVGRLVEAFCFHHGIRFRAVGSLTHKEEGKRTGAEPDECYQFADFDSERAELAIERAELAIVVVWTHDGLDKLETWRRLGMPELWVWRKGAITVRVLRGEQYVEAPHSEALPGLDLELLAGFLDRPTTFDAVMAYRTALEKR